MKKVLLTGLCAVCCHLFVRAQETDINSAINLYNDAVAAFNNKDYKAALPNAEQALQIASTLSVEDTTGTMQNIQTLILRIYDGEARQLNNEKKYAEAVALLKKTVETATLYNNEEFKNSSNELIPEVLMNIATELFAAQKYAEAIPAYEAVLAVTPDDASAYWNIGQANLQLNNEATAITALEKAHELGSKDATEKLADVFYNKAVVANKAKKWNDVLTAAQKSLGYDATGNAVNKHKLSGFAAIQLKKWDAAIENLEKILPMEKNPDNTIYQLATAYESKGNKAKACENYRKITGNPNFKAYAEAKVKALCK